jgi:hypothetical protein
LWSCIDIQCGHALTYKVLSSESDVIIYCSLLRPAIPDDDIVRACMSGGESPTHVGPLKDGSSIDKTKLASTPTDEINAEPQPTPVFNPEDLIGQAFLMDEEEDGQQFDKISSFFGDFRRCLDVLGDFIRFHFY